MSWGSSGSFASFTIADIMSSAMLLLHVSCSSFLSPCGWVCSFFFKGPWVPVPGCLLLGFLGPIPLVSLLWCHFAIIHSSQPSRMNWALLLGFVPLLSCLGCTQHLVHLYLMQMLLLLQLSLLHLVPEVVEVHPKKGRNTLKKVRKHPSLPKREKNPPPKKEKHPPKRGNTRQRGERPTLFSLSSSVDFLHSAGFLLSRFSALRTSASLLFSCSATTEKNHRLQLVRLRGVRARLLLGVQAQRSNVYEMTTRVKSIPKSWIRCLSHVSCMSS